jgi:hypothetical protein
MDREEFNSRRNAYLFVNYYKMKQETLVVPMRKAKADQLTGIVQKVKALSRCGKTQREISALLAISVGSVCKFLKMK